MYLILILKEIFLCPKSIIQLTYSSKRNTRRWQSSSLFSYYLI